MIMSSREIAENRIPRARPHDEWEDKQVGRDKGIGVAPRPRTPANRRGSERLGHDNAKIYGELLGIGEEEMQELAREGVIYDYRP